MNKKNKTFQIVNPTYGSDFELAVKNMFKGDYISVAGLLGGSKIEPMDIGQGCKKQEDNVNAEFNIPPVVNKKQWSYYINYCVTQINKELNPNNLVLQPYSSYIYDEDQLQTPQAKEFGCSESFDAYSEDVLPKPKASNKNLRTAGFHVHVGFKTAADNLITDADIYRFIKTMDLFLGVPSILIDKDRVRRQLYGKAGEHRVKVIYEAIDDTYLCIIEYRCLGSNLLAGSKIINWVFEQTQRSVKEFNSNLQLPGQIVPVTMNNYNETLAKELIKKYKINMPDMYVIDGVLRWDPELEKIKEHA